MKLQSALQELGQGTACPSFDIFRTHLDPAWIQQALLETGTLSLRHRKVPAPWVVWLVLGMALLRDRSIPAVLSHLDLCLPGVQAPTASALVQARDRLGEEPLQVLYELTAGFLQAQLPQEHRFKGLRTLGLDGSVLRVPDSPENAEAFGIPKSGRSLGAYPQLRLVSLVDTVSHIVLRSALGPCSVGEGTLAQALWAQIPEGTLTCLDRNFSTMRSCTASSPRARTATGCCAPRRTCGGACCALWAMAAT